MLVSVLRASEVNRKSLEIHILSYGYKVLSRVPLRSIKSHCTYVSLLELSSSISLLAYDALIAVITSIDCYALQYR